MTVYLALFCPRASESNVYYPDRLNVSAKDCFSLLSRRLGLFSLIADPPYLMGTVLPFPILMPPLPRFRHPNGIRYANMFLP